MDETLRARLENTIEGYEGIRCVYITKKDKFFIFNKSFRDYSEDWSDWQENALFTDRKS